MTADAQAAFGEPDAKGRASIAGYVIAGVIAVVGIGAAIAWVVFGFLHLADAVDGLHRIPVGAARVVHLDAGRQGIYYEGPGGEKAGAPALAIAVISSAEGRSLPVGGYSGSVTYSVGGHAGRSVAGFDVHRPGAYRIAVRGAAGPGAQIAVGPGLGHRIVHAIVGGVVLFVLGILASGVLIILTASRRRQPSDV